MTARSTLPPVAAFNPFNADNPDALLIFGTGGRGLRCRNILEKLGITVLGFIDNDTARQGLVIEGCPVHAPAALAGEFAGRAVIISSYAEESISRQLRVMGIEQVYSDGAELHSAQEAFQKNKDKLDRVASMAADDASREALQNAVGFRCNRPYYTHSAYPLYAHPLVRAEKGDVIIDGGAAEGDTLEFFMNECGGECSIHLFEPTPGSFRDLRDGINAAGLRNAHPVNAALWNTETKLTLTAPTPCGHDNRVSAGNEAGVTVRAQTLDSYVREAGLDRVDLIKLDIEGAEYEALEGARETIEKCRPKLQICLYHKVEDLWTIPLLIKDMVPEYTMYMGLHTCRLLDLVLYCTVR